MIMSPSPHLYVHVLPILLILICNQFCIHHAFQQPSVFVSKPYHSSSNPTTREVIQNEDCLPLRQHTYRQRASCLRLSSSSESESASVKTVSKDNKASTSAIAPQVLASGYSQDMDMVVALKEAVDMALASLPAPDENSTIDLAIVSVSSLYDGKTSPSLVVPTILTAASVYGKGVQQLIGSTIGGWISSRADPDFNGGGTKRKSKSPNNVDDDGSEDDESIETSENPTRACTPLEQEGIPGVSIVFCLLPDVKVSTFHVVGDDVPDDYGRMSPSSWKRSIGLSSSSRSSSSSSTPDDQGEKILHNNDENPSAVFLLPSPAFSNTLDDLLRGMETNLPGCNIFGAIASTVSSLSRARLFRHDATEADGTIVQTLADGCVGAAMSGDIEVQTMIAQGAKPVGGIYQIVKGQDQTIFSIALDEIATELVQQAEAGEGQDDDEHEEDEAPIATDRKSQLAQIYAKARIPKPVLAEANFLMKTLNDEDQSFMRKTILVGLSQGGSLGRTPSELARLAEGKGHSFTVHQVASASMKDGSITLSLACVNIEQGMRMRFFVRESSFAKREIDALWMGYKKRALTATLQGNPTVVPTGCFLFPTLDRGNKFFLGKTGFESSAISQYLPTVPCISGFFSNGVIGALNTDMELGGKRPTRLNGSASGYIVIGSKSDRPTYSAAKAVADKASTSEWKAEEERFAKDDKASVGKSRLFDVDKKAPRDEKGELILKRREVHSGRALTVSTVEWSVQESMATPSSTLEGFMWDKETEVDRFRERVPLANLVSQFKLSLMDPSKPKPRDWIGVVKEAATDGKFVIIPECKRIEPSSGSVRQRYDVPKLVKDFTMKGAPALCVNCDGVLFGGSLEDLTKAREASSKAALEKNAYNDDGVIVPPILASDLLLYPYQLYKIRLAGADAVNLITGALAAKDLVYLTKIAASMQIQTLLTVSSITQIENLSILAPNGIDGLIVSNRKVRPFTACLTERAEDVKT
jgi:indole-3-glycerol phosphate synthase